MTHACPARSWDGVEAGFRQWEEAGQPGWDRLGLEIFHDARPFDAATAKLALQPLVNLGRLRTRDGTGTAAHRLIEALFTAVRHQAAVNLDGRIADLGHLTRTPDDHREIIQWLWTVLLADGTRALTQAGRWSQALQHVQDHHGIGRSLLDGRQIAIIAHHSIGDHRTSARLLAETTTPTPWEQTVAACLTVLTGNNNGNATTIVDSYLTLGGAPTQVVFRNLTGEKFTDMWNRLIDLGQAGDEILAAWIAKEELRTLLALARTGASRHQISHRLWTFYQWCADTDITELHRLARTIQAWWTQIEAFIHTGITNAASEGVNRLIKLEARNAFGFRNPINQRLRSRCASIRTSWRRTKPG